jgi:membrane-bound serine protease (ClpP class)
MKKVIFFMIFMGIFSLAYPKNVYFLEVSGIVSPFTVKYIKKGINIAKNDSDYFVLKLDTPGGVLESTRKIVQNIFESDLKIITFVAPQGARAGSAGTFIVLASDIAVMAEGTNIGAAHPVSPTGEDIKGDMRKKVENDAVAFIKAIAEKRGRNVDVAVLTVTESKSYTANEALNINLIDYIANSDSEILQIIKEKYNETDLNISYIKPNVYEKISIFLADPNVLILLLIIAILSIFLELKMPGTFVFAGVGIAAILLFLFGINIIPMNYLAFLLIIAGITLIILEIFVPSFGLLTVAAIVSLTFGMKLLFNRQGNMEIAISNSVIITLIILILFIVFIIARLVIKDFKKKPETGMEKLLGMQAQVKFWENGRGKVFINGEFWNAVSEDDLKPGDDVKVTSYKDMTLYVTKR